MPHLRVFGCTAYAHVLDDERRKLDKKSKRMRFVGYSLTSKGYRLFDDANRKLFIGEMSSLMRKILDRNLQCRQSHNRQAGGMFPSPKMKK